MSYQRDILYSCYILRYLKRYSEYCYVVTFTKNRFLNRSVLRCNYKVNILSHPSDIKSSNIYENICMQSESLSTRDSDKSA